MMFSSDARPSGEAAAAFAAMRTEIFTARDVPKRTRALIYEAIVLWWTPLPSPARNPTARRPVGATRSPA